jgi:uncharacterized protein
MSSGEALHMVTITGREHHLSGCGSYINEVDPFDIAHSLAQVNRFTGHATRPYCVAEHSLLCADLAARAGHDAMVQLLCLMHDAHEAYTNDASTPQKNAIGVAWATFEHRHADRVRRQLGLTTGFAVHGHLVKHFDAVALATERRDLTHFDEQRHTPWPIDEPGRRVLPAEWVNLNSLDRVNAAWSHWKDAFLTRLADLQQQVQAHAASKSQPFHHAT